MNERQVVLVSSNESRASENTDTGDRAVSDTSLEALYNLNKHAKQYATRATQHYENGKKTTAKANSNKKKALYRVKERVLDQIHQHADTVAVHVIDGTEFYYVAFGDWGFHTPRNGYVDIDDARVEDRERLLEFTKTGAKERSSMSLKESLLHVESVFGVNANEHLPDTHLYYGSSRYFIGWKYLG